MLYTPVKCVVYICSRVTARTHTISLFLSLCFACSSFVYRTQRLNERNQPKPNQTKCSDRETKDFCWAAMAKQNFEWRQRNTENEPREATQNKKYKKIQRKNLQLLDVYIVMTLIFRSRPICLTLSCLNRFIRMRFVPWWYRNRATQRKNEKLLGFLETNST